MSIAFLIIGLIIGCVLCYFVLQPKIKYTNEINSNIERENNNLQDQKEKLQTNIMDLQKQAGELYSIKENLATEVASYTARKEELDKHIAETRKQIESDNEIIFEKSFDLM